MGNPINPSNPSNPIIPIIPQSKMGFGCMRLPLLDESDQTSIDIEQFKQMVDAFMETGHTYFDTAFVYHDGASETAIGEALVARYPRESFTLATKCLAWAMPDAASAKSCLDTSLERMGTDYVDYYLLHNVGDKRTAKFDAYGMWEWAQEQKAAGKIRFVGFSMHDDAARLDELLTAHPEMDFVQLQVNYLDWDDPHNEARRLMEVAAKHGKPVTIMEPARGGRLCNLPQAAADILAACNPRASQAEWAYRFCWNLPNVLAVLSGASTIEQMRENVASYAANAPFTPAEETALGEAIGVLRSLAGVPCTACNYCMKGCPSHVQIPQVMELLNLEAMTGDHAFVKDLYSWQTAEGRAGACVKCGKCEAMCPQHIDIIRQLERAVELYE
ncbi:MULTISPECIES: aldo/keto reductase [unclassified Adlercreutzia]|uniref:aldo/keto reductase n=1 Tax=unclassified Adlercreutzia TaxID=2636013 RepID=UPI001F14CE21|nr:MULTISPECIES: aldo/keto reductase [unclassified Adlercreutzia]